MSQGQTNLQWTGAMSLEAMHEACLLGLGRFKFGLATTPTVLPHPDWGDNFLLTIELKTWWDSGGLAERIVLSRQHDRVFNVIRDWANPWCRVTA